MWGDIAFPPSFPPGLLWLCARLMSWSGGGDKTCGSGSAMLFPHGSKSRHLVDPMRSQFVPAFSGYGVQKARPVLVRRIQYWHSRANSTCLGEGTYNCSEVPLRFMAAAGIPVTVPVGYPVWLSGCLSEVTTDCTMRVPGLACPPAPCSGRPSFSGWTCARCSPGYLQNGKALPFWLSSPT